MESTDGRIWFHIARSDEWKTIRSGTAWFDPVTREGCWFTSEAGPLAEDPAGNLWLLIDGVLYSTWKHSAWGSTAEPVGSEAQVAGIERWELTVLA